MNTENMAPRCLVEAKIDKFVSDIQLGIFDFVIKKPTLIL